MTNLTAIQTATLFNVSREAIRQYSLKFAEFLSPVARPEQGRQRMFTPPDLEVISLVVSLKAEGKIFDDIYAALRNGQRGDIPEMDRGIIPRSDSNEMMLSNRILELTAELHSNKGQIELLKEQLRETQARLERLIAENAVLKNKQGS